MKNLEPTDEQINDYLVGNPNENLVSAKKKLKERMARKNASMV